ncbi:MAG: N-acetyltransferase [Lysobacteraceae bacterium]|nr:MAG: N-acetyltransferase [Xanthomonadaceae bacterium]
MTNGDILRAERPADIADIDRTIRAAFAMLNVGVRTEHHIVAGLRAAGALTLSLVAERGQAIVGHVAISPVTISDGAAGWYGLGPVAVVPELQREGIGQSLIRAALTCMRNDGAHGCVVYGHPDYYPRFGFARDPDLILPGAASTHFFALRWRDAAMGTVAYHPAFSIGR